jgi:hypothetical protein
MEKEVMKKVFIIATVLVLTFVSPVFSADNAASTKTSEADLEQQKADIIKKLDKRIAKIKDKRSCIQEATSTEDFKACDKGSKRPKNKE